MFYKISVAMSILMGMNCRASESSFKGINQMIKNYSEEEVHYKVSPGDIIISGTLTLPNGIKNPPAVILISGYGANDRDVTGMGHQYFKVLAEYLTHQGIAVLRFDKRGVGKSTGDWSAVTSEELAQDVLAGIDYLKTRQEINQDGIGLVGLSEGGLIASMVAAQSNDIAFVVLMAPFVDLGVESVVCQAGLQLSVDGASPEFVKNDKIARTVIYTIIQQEPNRQIAIDKMREAILDYVGNLPDSQKIEAEKLSWAFTEAKIDIWTNVLTSPGYRFFLKYDPTVVLEGISVPVLVIAGGNDLMTSPDRIFPILRRAFEKSGHRDYTIVELPKLNHMFQTCKTGALSEYAEIEETMAPIALKTISDWILERNI